MKLYLTTFYLAKLGNTKEEYEDAFYPKENGYKEGKKLSFSIADGASEGLWCGKWAEILVKSFCENEFLYNKFDENIIEDFIQVFTQKSYQNWNQWKEDYQSKRKNQGKEIQWYEEIGLGNGAFSTLLGLIFEDYEEENLRKWTSLAIGDSCLFHIHKDELKIKFPLEYSSDFNNRPLLFSSNPFKNKQSLNSIKKITGAWDCDDQFYLMTDALAYWFLKEFEENRKPWNFLCDLDTSDQTTDFYQWINELRTKKAIRNDDVTLIRIDVL